MATHFPTLTYGALRLVQRAALGFLAVCALSWYATGVAEAPTPTPATQQRRLRIGIIAPLSGAIATWGQSVQSAIQIAHDEAGQPAELFFEDEGACSATMALSAFRVLTTVKKVDIVIASCLNSARAIAPLAQTSGLPILVSGRSTTEFQQAQPNVLSWLALLNDEGRAIAQLIAARGWQRGAAIVSGYFGLQWSKAIQESTRGTAPAFTLDVKESGFDSTPSTVEVITALRHRPDVIFLCITDAAHLAVVKQLRTMRYQGAIVLQSSSLFTLDKASRTPFVGALQQKFEFNNEQFSRLQNLISKRLGLNVADDFVFSYDGFNYSPGGVRL